MGSRNTSHTYDSQNRLSSLNTNGVYSGFTYDNRGNITAKGAQGYYFDQGNRLVLAQKNGSTVATYVYDGHGRRLYASGTSSQPSRTTVYGLDGKLLYSIAQQGASLTNTRYIYLGGKLIAEDGTLGQLYDVTDVLGSPVAKINAASQVTTTTSYEPYGKTAAGADPAMVGFTGHVNDPDTGLVYMQQRYYDPIASRFMSEDPVTTDAETGKSFGRFHYAENNPYRYIDPDGRDPNVALFDPMDYLKTLAIESIKFGGMAAGGAGGAVEKGALAVAAAREAAVVARAEGATGGAVSAVVTKAGEVFTGASTRSGGPGQATKAVVQAAVDSTPAANQSAYRPLGCCGEADAFSKLLNAGAEIKDAVVATVRTTGSAAGKVMDSCSTCQWVANKLGVKTVPATPPPPPPQIPK